MSSLRDCILQLRPNLIIYHQNPRIFLQNLRKCQTYFATIPNDVVNIIIGLIPLLSDGISEILQDSENKCQYIETLTHNKTGYSGFHDHIDVWPIVPIITYKNWAKLARETHGTYRYFGIGENSRELRGIKIVDNNLYCQLFSYIPKQLNPREPQYGFFVGLYKNNNQISPMYLSRESVGLFNYRWILDVGEYTIKLPTKIGYHINCVLPCGLACAQIAINKKYINDYDGHCLVDFAKYMDKKILTKCGRYLNPSAHVSIKKLDENIIIDDFGNAHVIDKTDRKYILSRLSPDFMQIRIYG